MSAVVSPVATPTGAVADPTAAAVADLTWAGVRVWQVPAAHPYVTQVSSPSGARPGRGEELRWDDVNHMLRVAADVDVVHLHFGFERCGAQQLEVVLDALDRAGVPVVWTAHDLTNPHLHDQQPHLDQLAVLAARAAVVLTLTDGAATQIQARWGRRAVVVAHPHLAPLDVLAAGHRPAQVTGDPRAVVGLPLGTLRPGTDPAVVRSLLAVLPAVPGVLLRVRLREEVLRADFPRPDPDLLAALRRAERDGLVDLRVGPRVSEPELWDELAGLSALVLPYRWGSHSGWVESCFDVGTPVVAPALGHWAEQHPVHTFRVGPANPDDASLGRALRAAVAAGPRTEPVLAARLAERAEVVRAHAAVHEFAAGGGVW